MQEVHPMEMSSGKLERGELYSVLLRLHPVEAGWVSPSSGREAHAAFLDIVRQNDLALAEQLHQPNQRRPFTVGLLQGFNHLSPAQLEEAMTKGQKVPVRTGQVYWLRITMLDAHIFGTFAQHLIMRPKTVVIRLGDARFEVSRLIGSPEPHQAAYSWAAYSSFTELSMYITPQKLYQFEFATPTAFSMGQKSWGKLLKLLPEPENVFESLARQWETFAPVHLRMSSKGLTPRDFAVWCEEHLIVTRYSLETRYLSSDKFAQAGFQGTITYEMKGRQGDGEAEWLSPLARLALFSGVGYKTTMGMGQARCTNLGNVPVTGEKEGMESEEVGV